jgi:hypothetical protein
MIRGHPKKLLEQCLFLFFSVKSGNCLDFLTMEDKIEFTFVVFSLAAKQARKASLQKSSNFYPFLKLIQLSYSQTCPCGHLY